MNCKNLMKGLGIWMDCFFHSRHDGWILYYTSNHSSNSIESSFLLIVKIGFGILWFSNAGMTATNNNPFRGTARNGLEQDQVQESHQSSDIFVTTLFLWQWALFHIRFWILVLPPGDLEDLSRMMLQNFLEQCQNYFLPYNFHGMFWENTECSVLGIMQMDNKTWRAT